MKLLRLTFSVIQGWVEMCVCVKTPSIRERLLRNFVLATHVSLHFKMFFFWVFFPAWLPTWCRECLPQSEKLRSLPVGMTQERCGLFKCTHSHKHPYSLASAHISLCMKEKTEVTRPRFDLAATRAAPLSHTRCTGTRKRLQNFTDTAAQVPAELLGWFLL